MHGIGFIGDDALPEGHDFVFVGTPDGGGLIFYKEGQISPKSLEDSWAAYRALLAEGNNGGGGPGEQAEGCPDCTAEPARDKIERRRHRWEHATAGDYLRIVV